MRCFQSASDAVTGEILGPSDGDDDAVGGVGNSRSRRRRGMIRRQKIRNPMDTLTSGVKGKRSSLD